MFLQYYLNEQGERVYTLKVRRVNGLDVSLAMHVIGRSGREKPVSCLAAWAGAGLETPEAARGINGSRNAWLLDLTVASPVFMFTVFAWPLMLKLKFQCVGHLMRRAGSFEKTLMLGKIEGRRRRGRQDEIVGWHHRLHGHRFG